MKIDIITKKILPVMLSLAMLSGVSAAVSAAEETADKTDLFAKHVSVSKAVTELIRNTDGTTGNNTTNGVFTDKSNFNYATQDGYLKVTNNYTSNSEAIARFCVRIAQAKGTLPAYNKANKLIIESKMRIDANTEADDWVNVGITNGIPTWEGTAIPLAGVKMDNAEDKTMKVRVGGFESATLAENQILDAVYPAGEFISYKITIDVPDGVADTDTVPVSYEINGVKQDYTAQLKVSLLKAVYNSTSPRIVYGTQNKYDSSSTKKLAWSVDDLIVTSMTNDNLYYKSADFTAMEALPADIISSKDAAPVFDGNNGIKFNVADKDQYGYFKSNGKYLSTYGKPFVVETRVKFDPFDNKGQLRIQARGRDSVNGSNAYNQAATMTLLTFNRGSIILRSNMNPQTDAPYSVKIGEFVPNVWYNVKLIFSIADEDKKMYAYVYTDDYSYETAGVVDIPLEKMHSYNLASLSEINSVGVFSGSSNGGRATSYVSDLKMYAADIKEGTLEYIETQIPSAVKDNVQVSFSDVVDLTQLNMTVKCNGEEYTDYQTQLAGDGKTLAIVPSTEWQEGSYTIEFNDTVKGYFGGACTVSDNIIFDFVLKTEVIFNKENKSVTAKLNDPTGKAKDAIMYFASYNAEDRLISADKVEVKNNQEITLSNLSEDVSYVQVFVWSKTLDMFTNAEKIYRSVN